MHAVTWLIGLAPMAIAYVLTGAMRRISLATGLLDVPNNRSSHAIPIPRGGGVAIVLGSLVAWSLLWALHVLDFKVMMALTVGGLAVAVIGLVDDRRPLRASVRLVVHLAAASWAVAWLGIPIPAIEKMSFPAAIGVQALTVLGIVWTLNLFNFMDGIDGIAASEAIFISWSGALLLFLIGCSAGSVAVALALGAACFGFLVWNWPPAKIFMGDVGSGYLGFVIGCLAIALGRENSVMIWVWCILSGVFLADATVTLARRLLRGERVYEAHRSHAYQWLARRWGSHSRVTLAVIGVNLLWLLPCAGIAIANPRVAPWAAVVALGGTTVGALLAGAGRAETR